MAEGILNFKDNDGWHALYVNYIQNRLRKDKNLSDLADSTEARKNLGLTGDVSDHHHDSRYVPMIEEVRGHADAIGEKIERIINDKLWPKINDIDQRCNSNTERIKSLESRMAKAEARLNSIDTRINNLTSRLNNLFDSEGYLVYPNGNKLRVVKK